MLLLWCCCGAAVLLVVCCCAAAVLGLCCCCAAAVLLQCCCCCFTTRDASRSTTRRNRLVPVLRFLQRVQERETAQQQQQQQQQQHVQQQGGQGIRTRIPLGLLLWNVFENRKRTFFSGRKTKRTFDRQSYHGRNFPDKLIGKRAPPRELQLQQYHLVRRLYSSRGAVHKKYRVLHRCTSPKL